MELGKPTKWWSINSLTTRVSWQMAIMCSRGKLTLVSGPIFAACCASHEQTDLTFAARKTSTKNLYTCSYSCWESRLAYFFMRVWYETKGFQKQIIPQGWPTNLQSKYRAADLNFKIKEQQLRLKLIK